MTLSEPTAFFVDFRMLNVMADIPANPIRLP